MPAFATNGTHMLQSTTIQVDYSKLVLADHLNAREAEGYGTKEDAELIASIKHKGLLQALTARPGKRGKYEVYAGKRRYLAIGALIKSGDWPAEQPVPVHVREETDHDALETSLVENMHRKPMHPVQEFEVFAKLNGEGYTDEAIALRYGLTIVNVRRALALGRLAPEILEAWRVGDINRDVAEAFAACQDKGQQASAYKKLKRAGMLYANNVRNHFVKGNAKLSDGRVKFVGLDRYKAAGGRVVESLFADDGYIEDSKLLDKLVEQRLVEKCAELEADGWSFAIPASDLRNHEHYSWAREQGRKAYTAEEKARLKEIEASLGKLNEVEGEQDFEVIGALEAEQEAIEAAAAPRGFSKAQKERSGCVITLRNGDVDIAYGLVRGKTQAQLDRAKEKAKAKANPAEDDDSEPDTQHISNALAHDITVLRTMAAREALAVDPALAVRVAAAALKCATGYGYPVRLRADGYRQNRFGPYEVDESEGAFDDVLASLKTMERAASTLAVALGAALDLTVHNAAALPSESVDAFVALLPGTTYLKAAREHFKAEDYFKRASGSIASAALAEMGRLPPNHATLRANDLKVYAIEAAGELGWLPVVLRHPEYSLLGTKKGRERMRVPA